MLAVNAFVRSGWQPHSLQQDGVLLELGRRPDGTAATPLKLPGRGRNLRGGCQVTRQVTLYGIKVSFWVSGFLKIVIYVENYPQKRNFWLDVYHPPLGRGGVN